MRTPVPDIHGKLRKLLEPRSPLACTLVSTETGHFVVLTLAPLTTARLMRRGRQTLWETRVHATDPAVRVGLASPPRYAVLSLSAAEASGRHEALVTRLETGSFEAETSREVLAPIRPFMAQGAAAFEASDHRGAVAAFDEAIRLAGQVDLVHSFLRLYQEAFLMRGLALERLDPDAAKGAYRDFIALYAALPSPHRDVLRAVAWAREAVERLTPLPRGDQARRRASAEGQVIGE